MARIFRRLRTFLFRRRFDRDVDRELSFHLDMAAGARRGTASGDGAQARSDAGREFGDLVRIREGIHDVRGMTSWDALRWR